jgi:hypothetical protein
VLLLLLLLLLLVRAAVEYQLFNDVLPEIYSLTPIVSTNRRSSTYDGMVTTSDVISRPMKVSVAFLHYVVRIAAKM